MSLKKTNSSLENLRRSSRTEILRLRAEAQQIEALKQQPPPQVISKDKPNDLTRKKKSLKKKKKNKRSHKRKIPTSNGTYKDDGFILDEPINENFVSNEPKQDFVSNQPKQFDELEVWKQYQDFGESDDGFIPDDDTTVNADQGKNCQKHEPEPVHIKKRKLSDIWKKDSSGKKLSKKKRRKAERKWLKKLFHESVIIAEPQENEPNDQTNAPFDEQSIVSNTIEVPVEIAGKTLVPVVDENGSSKDQTTTDPGMLNSSEMTLTVPANSDRDLIIKAKSDIHEYSTYLQTNGNPPTLYPWTHQEEDMEGIHEMNRQKSLHNDNDSFQENIDESSPPMKALDGQNELEKLRLSGGFSQSEFTQHLIKLHNKYTLDSLSLEKSPVKKNKEPEVMTKFIDLTSGKVDTDEKKKRYKMELSLPEKTTILVTNMVARESSLPKVIFMLKKGPTNGGTQQESPLLMGCSGDTGKNGTSMENDTVLVREVQEITKHILKMQTSSVTPIKNSEELMSIPKALEYSME